MSRVIAIGGLVFIAVIFVFSFSSWANVLNNASFEDGEDSWYNWNEDASTCSGEISSEQSRTGTYSACREILGAGKGCFGQILTIAPEEEIKASVWIMNPSSEPLSNGAEAYLRIEFWKVHEGMGEPLGSGHIESIHITESTKWIKVEAKGTTPKGSTETRILGFTNGKNNSSKGKVYFDDFETTIVSKLH